MDADSSVVDLEQSCSTVAARSLTVASVRTCRSTSAAGLISSGPYLDM